MAQVADPVVGEHASARRRGTQMKITLRTRASRWKRKTSLTVTSEEGVAGSVSGLRSDHVVPVS